MDAARLLERLDHQGLTLFAQGARLIVRPGNLLTANDETLIREHKPELLRLARLRDAETVYRALVEAGPAGLAWREGTPPDWPDERLLAVGEVLYADGRMVNVLGRRYLAAQAPRLTEQRSDTASSQTTPQSAPSAATGAVSSTVERTPTDLSALPASDRMDPLHREDPDNPQAARIAELMAASWAPWNAKARAESEALPGWQHPPRSAGDPGETLGCG